MAVVDVVSVTGEKAGEKNLSAEVFEAPLREHLLYETVKWQMNARRSGTACTKTRGEVAGGGRKPYRQKGTGRARQGSIRAPHWVGGGTVFGPRPRSYATKLPKKARRAALRSALSAKLRDGELMVVDELRLEDHKTKSARAMLQSLGLWEKKLLIVVPRIDLFLDRSTRNLPFVKVLPVDGLNVYDLLDAEVVLCTQAAVEMIEERLS